MSLSLFTVALAAAAGFASPRKSIVVTDVDGTLFSFAGRDLSDGNRRALTECVESGVHVSLATGRIPGPWFDALKEQVPGIGACVFGNGALVVDGSGSPIWESQLPDEIVAAVREYTLGGCAGGDSAARLCVLAATRWEPGAPHAIRYVELSPDGSPSAITSLIERAGEPDAVLLPSLDGLEARGVLKFVIWTLPGEDGWASMDATVCELRARLEGLGATILHHGDRWCEVLPPGVDKGSGVLKLLSSLGVAPEDALAVGDAENDLSMLRIVGIGAAPANAQPAALAAADVVVPSNSDDGVAAAIRKYVLPEEGANMLDFYTLDMCPFAQRCPIPLSSHRPFSSRQ